MAVHVSAVRRRRKLTRSHRRTQITASGDAKLAQQRGHVYELAAGDRRAATRELATAATLAALAANDEDAAEARAGKERVHALESDDALDMAEELARQQPCQGYCYRALGDHESPLPQSVDTAYGGRRPRRIVRSLRSNARSFMRCKEDARIPCVNDFPQLAGVTPDNWDGDGPRPLTAGAK